MVNPTVRGRAGAGAGSRQRSVAAAARAAARRVDKAHGPDGSGDGPEEQDAQRASTGAAADPGTEETPGTGLEKKNGPAGAANPSRVRSGMASAVLAVLVVAALVATVVLGWQYHDADQTRQARTGALAVAQKAAPVILSYDHQHLDRDFAAATGHLTGQFREKYRKTTTSVVEPTAKKYQGVVKASVAKPPSGDAPAASVVSASPDKVVVLLFMNQVTKSTQVSGPRLDLNRVRMTLVRASDSWKVSAVDAL